MNKKKIWSSVLLTLGFALFICGIVMLSLKMNWVDESDYGDYHFTEEFLGAGKLFTSITLIGLLTVLFGFYTLFSKKFNNLMTYLYALVVGGISALEGIGYSILFADKVFSRIQKAQDSLALEDTAKAIDKAGSKLAEIASYPNPTPYVIWGLVGAIVCGYALSKILIIAKEDQSL